MQSPMTVKRQRMRTLSDTSTASTEVTTTDQDMEDQTDLNPIMEEEMASLDGQEQESEASFRTPDESTYSLDPSNQSTISSQYTIPSMVSQKTPSDSSGHSMGAQSLG